MKQFMTEARKINALRLKQSYSCLSNASILLENISKQKFYHNKQKSKLIRIPNLHKGKIRISEDFNKPLPDIFWLGEE